MRLFILIFIILLNAWALPARADDTPTKLPRFVSLKSDKVFARAGPDQQYPVSWVYQRAGLPVEVTQENDAWRKIRDAEGGEGWVNKVLLSGKRSVLLKSDTPVTLYDAPDPGGRVMARAEPGVVAGLKKCTTDWCEINADGYKGWVQRKLLWGIYPGENLN